MTRSIKIGLVVLLTALAALPSLAQKRFPAPVVFFDGEVINSNWVEHGNRGRQRFLKALDNPDIPFAILLRFQWFSGAFGGQMGRPIWCLDWVIADRNGVTKSKEYSWRITVIGRNNKPLKYVGDAPPPSISSVWKPWGKEGWHNLDPHTDRWYSWDKGNLLPTYGHLWCGLDGDQRVRTRIQLIDQHGNPAGVKSKILRFKLGPLPTS